WIEVREKTRRLHHNLAGVAGGFITLSATGAAPLGLESTGDPVFNLPASFIGAPAVTLPCLSAEALPLGIQLMGFKDEDEALFSHAQWVENILLAEH
ncbi:MAG: hypothetical protein KAI93_17045, partial [Desulfobacterales bacterium]|nr:hypothetical protein [Desulfobacterales bacterium]